MVLPGCMTNIGVDRRGGGSHEAVMRGVRILQRRKVPFHIIAVITAEALDAADEILDFFQTLGATEIGFNIDEQEGVRARSSLGGENLQQRFAGFMQRVLCRSETRAGPMVREIRNVLSGLLNPDFDGPDGCDENEPFRIVTVLHDGRLSTYSPELAGMHHPRYGEFSFGNVSTAGLADVLTSAHFLRIASEIEAGVVACRGTCAYFRLCRGGAPANKLWELGTFVATETQHCRLAHQTVADVVLARLQATLGPARRA